MATIEHINKYKVKSGDLFFFDNNVWMLLFSAAVSGSRSREQKIYGDLLDEIRCVNATVFINSLVASEYVNANLRLGFKFWKEQPGNEGKNSYKDDYKPTESFKENIDVVTEELKMIMKIADKKPDDFNAIDPVEALSKRGVRMDFNDSYYMTYCKLNNLILVTDDSDMLDAPEGIKILTK